MESNVILERLVKLETAVGLQFTEMEKALILAREQIERDKRDAANTLNHRLEGMNEFQKRMDKLEGTFITEKTCEQRQKEIDRRVSINSRLIYIAVGIFLMLEFLIRLPK